MFFFQQKYNIYSVKQIPGKKVIVSVYEKTKNKPRIEKKVIISWDMMMKEYPGYTLPSNLFAIDMKEGSITQSPCNVGYVHHDKIFKIIEENEEEMFLRLMKQWEWDLFSSKKFLNDYTSQSNIKFFKDMQKLK